MIILFTKAFMNNIPKDIQIFWVINEWKNESFCHCLWFITMKQTQHKQTNEIQNIIQNGNFTKERGEKPL